MKDLFKDETGRLIISILLGLGLAALFRRVCKDKKCMIIKCENPQEVQEKVYRHNEKCYKYKSYTVTCDL